MNALDYPVTTPFGYVPGYPLNNGFHNGIDYGCPSGTPIVVNGVTIGLSGNTGYSSGAHCHVGRWVNGAATNPNGGGATFNSAVVTQINNDSVNGNYVRVQGDGASWVYLHMSNNQLVSVGQVLTPKGDDMIPDQDNYFNRWSDLFIRIRGRAPSRDEFKANAVGLTWLKAIEILSDGQEAADAEHAQEVGQLAIKDQWDQQIYSLQAQLKDTTDKLSQVASKSDLSSTLQKQVDDLTNKNTALINQSTQDTATGQSFFRAIAKLLRLG